MYSEIILPLQALLKMLNHLSYHLGYWLQLQIILMTFITGIKFPLNYSLIWLGQKMVLFWLLKELLHQKWNWRKQNYKVFWKNKLNFLFRLITLYLVWSGKHFQIILFCLLPCGASSGLIHEQKSFCSPDLYDLDFMNLYALF